MKTDIDYLDTILNNQKPMIRVETFESKYVPLIFDKDPSLFNLRWVDEVSKNQYNEVVALDENNEVVYIIPPLRKPVKSTTDQSIARLTNQAKLESQVHIIKATTLMDNNLPKLVKFADARSSEIEQRWSELLTNLGYGDVLVMLGDKTTLADGTSTVEMGEDSDW